MSQVTHFEDIVRKWEPTALRERLRESAHVCVLVCVRERLEGNVRVRVSMQYICEYM